MFTASWLRHCLCLAVLRRRPVAAGELAHIRAAAECGEHLSSHCSPPVLALVTRCAPASPIGFVAVAVGPDQFFEVEERSNGHLKLAGMCGYVPEDSCTSVGPRLYAEARSYCYVGSATLDVHASALLSSPAARELSLGDVLRGVQLCVFEGTQRMRIGENEWVTYWAEGFVEAESVGSFDVHSAPQWPRTLEAEILQQLQLLDKSVSLSEKLLEVSCLDNDRTGDPHQQATVQLLRDGADPNFPYNRCHRESPLLQACLYARTETIRELVRHGASEELVGIAPAVLSRIAGDGVYNGSRVGLHQCGTTFSMQKPMRESTAAVGDGTIEVTCTFNQMCPACEDTSVESRSALRDYFDGEDHRTDSEAGCTHALQQREVWRRAAEHYWHQQGGLTAREKLTADHSKRGDGGDSYGNVYPGKLLNGQLSGEGAPVWTAAHGRGRVSTHKVSRGTDETISPVHSIPHDCRRLTLDAQRSRSSGQSRRTASASPSGRAPTPRPPQPGRRCGSCSKTTAFPCGAAVLALKHRLSLRCCREPRWVRSHEASVCMQCQTQKFSLKAQKHHCRSCGWAVCGSCSGNSLLLDRWLLPDKPHDVCETKSAEELRVCDTWCDTCLYLRCLAPLPCLPCSVSVPPPPCDC